MALQTESVELPEEAQMLLGTLTLTLYMLEDGTQGYHVAARGDVNMSSYLGLTVVAQQQILEWSQ